ncbi:MAG: hypothetical protein KME05_07570 [Gloeocapsa sp. UFS-A4-WI-NPMV-4B04]|nr:hypothetical protein [Gloeocapsa sp. UFS-A4-WI-NPMV-4B04]
MFCPTTACCVVTLNQKQQQTIHHCNQSADNTSVKHAQPKLKNCTVVEDGRVVVKICIS